eukprot:12583000-Alexandrium_andersonii.AAC.1
MVGVTGGTVDPSLVQIGTGPNTLQQMRGPAKMVGMMIGVLVPNLEQFVVGPNITKPIGSPPRWTRASWRQRVQASV